MVEDYLKVTLPLPLPYGRATQFPLPYGRVSEDPYGLATPNLTPLGDLILPLSGDMLCPSYLDVCYALLFFSLSIDLIL